MQKKHFDKDRNMRKLASIVTIATADPIPETDRLDVVTLVGKAWRIVTGRNEFRPGDRAVYFEINSALPIDDGRCASHVCRP